MALLPYGQLFTTKYRSAIALRQPAEVELLCYNGSMYFVYAINNKKNDKFYIGQCENLSVRLDLHNNKEFSNSYTSRFDGDWEIIYDEEVDSRYNALIREKQLKSYRGREYIKNLFRDSSTVEQLTVNQLVPGSNPGRGAL